QNGRRDRGERFTQTDSFGNYSFTNLTPGSYRVAEEGKPGWQQTAPPGGFHDVTITSGRIVTGRDFGNTAVASTEDHPPVFLSTPPAAAVVGQTWRYNATASDPDHDPLRFDLSVSPGGMAINPLGGEVAWTPVAEQVGVHDVILRVGDGRGGVALQPFRVTVTPAN